MPSPGGRTTASGWISFLFSRAGPEFSSGEGVPIYRDGRVKDNHLPRRCAWVLLLEKEEKVLRAYRLLSVKGRTGSFSRITTSPRFSGACPDPSGYSSFFKEEKRALRAAGVDEQKLKTDN